MYLNRVALFLALLCTVVVQAAPVDSGKSTGTNTNKSSVVGNIENGVADVAKQAGEKVDI